MALLGKRHRWCSAFKFPGCRCIEGADALVLGISFPASSLSDSDARATPCETLVGSEFVHCLHFVNGQHRLRVLMTGLLQETNLT